MTVPSSRPAGKARPATRPASPGRRPTADRDGPAPPKPSPEEVRKQYLAWHAATRAALLELARQINAVVEFVEAEDGGPGDDLLDPGNLREAAVTLLSVESEVHNALYLNYAFDPDPGAFDRLREAVGY